MKKTDKTITLLVLSLLIQLGCSKEIEQKEVNKVASTVKRIEFKDLPEAVQEELTLMEVQMMENSVDPVKVFKRITKKYPGFVTGRLNLASVLLNAGKLKKAKSVYLKVLKSFPKELGAVAGLSTVLAAEGNYNEAEKMAKKAVDGGYKWPPCYEVIAKSMEKRGALADAADYYLKGYRLHPHSWQYLGHYCRLKKLKFTPPTQKIDSPISNKQLRDLIDYIEMESGKKDEKGNAFGCDHSFRFAEKWAELNDVPIIQLYQFLNHHGGFCDCEICFNVSNLLQDE